MKETRKGSRNSLLVEEVYRSDANYDLERDGNWGEGTLRLVTQIGMFFTPSFYRSLPLLLFINLQPPPLPLSPPLSLSLFFFRLFFYERRETAGAKLAPAELST